MYASREHILVLRHCDSSTLKILLLFGGIRVQIEVCTFQESCKMGLCVDCSAFSFLNLLELMFFLFSQSQSVELGSIFP